MKICIKSLLILIYKGFQVKLEYGDWCTLCIIILIYKDYSICIHIIITTNLNIQNNSFDTDTNNTSTNTITGRQEMPIPKQCFGGWNCIPKSGDFSVRVKFNARMDYVRYGKEGIINPNNVKKNNKISKITTKI